MKSWYEVLVHRDVQREATRWCGEQFGERWDPIDNRGGIWSVFLDGRDDFSTYRYIFTNEQDVALFILRWL